MMKRVAGLTKCIPGVIKRKEKYLHELHLHIRFNNDQFQIQCNIFLGKQNEFLKFIQN